ncbi:transposase [Klebsiella pneumoniae MRSN 3562]|uniref:Transposase n=1 Tax=Escherichia coli TaxID=562 RepID=A0A8E2GT73_ECOLX
MIGKDFASIIAFIIERKIILLFAQGISYQDISREFEDLYAFSMSTATISVVR